MPEAAPQIQPGLTDADRKAAILKWITGVGESPITGRVSEIPGAENINLIGPPMPPDQMANLLAQTNRRGFAERNYKGVPILPDEEPNVGAIIGESFRTQPDQKIKYWQDKIGENNVRVADTGQILLKLQDSNGNIVEIPSNSKAFHTKDIARLAGTIPEMAGAASGTLAARPLIGKLSTFFGKAFGPIGFARDVVAGSIGAEAAGALKDMAVRGLFDKMDPEPLRVMGDRAWDIPKDIIAGGALGLLTVLGRRAVTPFMGERPPIQIDAKKARQFFKDHYGVDIEYTAGELTGSKFFQRMESLAKVYPGGSAGFSDIAESQDSAFRSIMNRLAGLPPDANDLQRMAFLNDPVGRDALAILRGATEPTEQRFISAAERQVAESNQAIANALSRTSVPVRVALMSDTGKGIRSRITAAWDEFRGKRDMLYNNAYSLPGGTDRIFPGGKLSKAAERLKATFPPKSEMLESIAMDSEGNPVTSEVGKIGVDKSFMPPTVMGYVESLASNPAEKRSLQDLVSMRTDVSNAINTAEALPGVKAHHLYKIRGILTDAINDATGSLPDGQLKRAWELANSFTARNMERFDRPAIKQILKDIDQGGLGNHALVSKAMGNVDFYNELKGFLGADSNEFASVKRHIADSLYERSLIPGTTQLDAKSFLSNLESIYTDRTTAEIAQDVLGKRSWARSRELYERAKSIAYIQGAKLDVDEVEKFLTGQPGSKYRSLGEMVNAQRELDNAYKNRFFRASRAGSSVSEKIDPSEFISRLANNVTEEEATEAMQIIRRDPVLEARVKAKMADYLLSEAARNPTPTDRVLFRTDPSRIVASEKLASLLNGPKSGVYEEILGPEAMDTMKMLSAALKPIEAKAQAFAAAGGIGAGQRITKLMEGALYAFLTFAAKNTGLSLLVTTKGVRKYLANQSISPESLHAFMTAVMTGEPAIRSLVAENGVKGGYIMADKIKEGLDSNLDTAYKAPIQKAQNKQAILDWINSTNK